MSFYGPHTATEPTDAEHRIVELEEALGEANFAIECALGLRADMFDLRETLIKVRATLYKYPDRARSSTERKP